MPEPISPEPSFTAPKYSTTAAEPLDIGLSHFRELRDRGRGMVINQIDLSNDVDSIYHLSDVR